MEQNYPLYQDFINFAKAFDLLNREALWKLLCKLGCPLTFIHILKDLHRNMTARFTFNVELSEEITVDNSVKQGDIPAPTLFLIYFAVVLAHAFQNYTTGIGLRFRITGRVFNLRRFNTRSETFQTLVRELLHGRGHAADYRQIFSSVLFLRSHCKLEEDQGDANSTNGFPYREPNIYVRGTRLGVVDTFVYLGRALSKDGALGSEIQARIQKVSVAFCKLEKQLWRGRYVTYPIKVAVYQACVLTTLLYSSQMWTICQQQLKWLEIPPGLLKEDP